MTARQLYDALSEAAERAPASKPVFTISPNGLYASPQIEVYPADIRNLLWAIKLFTTSESEIEVLSEKLHTSKSGLHELALRKGLDHLRKLGA